MDWKNSIRNQSIYKNIKTSTGDLRNGRTFNGPSEKRQYYSKQFTFLAQKSDPHNKFMTKIQLNETEKSLRNMITTHPRMYKLAQIIVDDCALLDDDVLELISSVPAEKICRCPESSIKKMTVQVEKQRRFLNLARFNKNRLIEMEKESATLKGSLSEIDLKTELDSLRNQAEINFFNSIASKPTHNVHIEPSVVIIAKALESFDKIVHQCESLFKAKLIDTDHMLALSLFSNANNAQSLEELFEKDSPCKTRFIILSSLLGEFSNSLLQFKKLVDAHQARGRIVAYLNQIKRRQDELFKEMSKVKRAQTSKDFELLVNFVKKNMPHFTLEPYFNKLFEIQKSVILLGT